MKYIDADRLRAEIESRKEAILSCPENGIVTFEVKSAIRSMAKGLLSFIDSLQQDFPTTDEQVKEFLAAHPKIEVPEKYKNPDWLFKKQEQPVADYDELDEAAQAYANGPDVAWVGTSALECAFKAGAEWKYQKDRGEFAKIKAKTWCEGFDAHKEQMLKEAVEGEYGYFSNASKTILPGGKLNLKEGDKVKIIIVKEDKQ